MSSIQDRINAMKKGESSSKKTESAALNNAPKVQSIQDRLAKARSDGLKQTGKPASTAPTKEYDLSGEAWTRATPSQTKIPSRETDAQENRDFFSRLGDAIRGGAKGSLASNSNAMSTFYAMGQGGRDAQNREYLAEYSRNLERAKLDMDAMLAENKEKPGSWSERDIQSQQYIIDDWQRKYDAMAKVLDERVQQKATQASYELADDIQQSSAQDIERAKEGLGSVGQVLVDAGASMTQTALDTAANALLGTPGSMGAFAMRAFGGGTQQARQDNPNSTLEQQALYGTASAAKEVFTEKMFNIALPFSHAYGGGALDDAVERGIRSAVNRFAKTDAGKRVLGGALTFGAGAVSEGLEEFIGDWMEWQMPRIYGGEAASAEETLENSLYDFLVGATSGMMGGVITPATYHYNVDETNTQQETAAPTRQAEAVPQTTAANELLTHAAEQASQNGRVNGKTADRILADQDAMAALEQAAGQVVQDGMTKSQQRKAVKSAVEGLARARETAAGETATTATSQQENAAETAQVRPAAQQAHDIKRMQQAASALGENGAKALNTVYDGNAASDSFYAGFVAYYEAGVSGMDMSKVRSEYSAQLNQAQKFAAYVAGQNDAEVSLARELRAAQYAKVAGTDSGLVFDDYVASSMDTATADRVNSIAKALGVRVRFVDSVRGGTANAQVSGSDILVEKNNPNPVMFLLGHEWTHRMQELAPDQYRAFRDAVAEEAQGEARVLLDQYRRAGENISYEAALDEAAANYAGRMIEDGKVLDDFIEKHRDNRTLLEKVRDAIRSIIAKLTGAERRQAQTAEGKLTAALEASAKQANALQGKHGDGTMGATRNSLKEDLENGRARKEERGAFLQRAAGSGYAIFEGDRIAYGYRPLQGKSAGENARQVQKEVNSLGIDADIIDGPILWNYNGITSVRDVPQAVTVAGRHIFISNSASLPPRNMAGHEAFHLWKNGVGRDVYIETVEDNLIFTNPDFLEYQSAIAEAYLGGEADLSNDAQVKKLREELFAYISGDIHEGVNDEFMRPMFRDFDAVKAAWNDLVEQNSEKARYSIKEYTDEEKKQHIKDAVSYFGRTYKWAETGYITTDGKRLDFSGRHEGGPGGYRTVDHRDIRDALDEDYGGEDYSGSMVQFMSEGNIRIMPESGGINLSVMPTKAQMDVLSDFISKQRGEVILDIDTPDGNTVSSTEYPRGTHSSKVLSDIKAYFEDGTKPYVSDVARFRYSLKTDSQGRALTEQQREYFKDSTAVDDQGRLMVMYHGTRKGGFTVFRDWSYLTANRKYAERYMDRDTGETMYEVYANIKKPFDTRLEECRAIWENEFYGEYSRTALQESGLPDWTDGYDLVDFLEENGYDYDAILLDEGADQVNGSVVERGISYVVRSSEQIKSITNENPTSDPDIRYSLKEDSRGNMLTEQQQRYFQDSKITDNDGRLMVMYHGTTAYGEITKFRKGRSGWLGPGIYLSSRKSDAQRYADAMGEGNGSLYELYANVTNPLVVTQNNPVPEILLAAYGRESVYKNRSAKQGNDTHIITPADIKKLQSKGYDGIRWDFGGNTELSVFSSEQLKRVGNTSPTGNPDIRYSLKPVPPARPKSKDWRPGATFDEVKAAHPTLFALDADEADTRNPTQISGTVKSYRKIYDALKAEGFDGTILDASSGLGYGTRAGREEYGFQVDDIEPFPDEKYKPMFTDYSTLEKTYDVIINNAVLNVMPQDLRDALVVKMGEMLKPGGRAFINVRGTDVKNASSKVAINDDLMEYFISNTGSYQKGFTQRELVAYLKDALGDGFSVEPTKKFGGVSAIVTRDLASYSIKGSETARETAKLREENDLLRERVEYWRGQTRRTKRVTTDKKAVTRAARELIRSYGSDLETTDISGDLQSMYDYIASGYDGADELTYTEARRRAEAIARKLVESAVTVDDDMYQQYSDLRSYLRTTKLTISEEDSHNIADYGDFRKRNMGRMTLTKGNTNIDRVYEEMAELWPEFFDPQRETHPADQLTRIADVMDGIYDIEEYNPFSNYMEQAVTGAANEIMEQFFDLPQTRATFADLQARKLEDAKAKGRQQVQKVREQSNTRLEELREQNRQRVQDAIAKERDRRDKQIEKLKTRYREKDAAGRERRNARELRAKIVRHANALSQKLLRPSDKQHIPESLRQATAAALEAINLESAYSVDPATGKRVKDGTGTPTKRTEAFRKLRLAYAEIAKDGGDYTLIIDPDLMDNLNELESMKDTPLMQMGTSQLETVWATIKAVEASIRTANKMLGASRFETISAFAEGIKVDNLTRKDRGDFGGNALGKMLAWGDKKANFDMLTPQGYFHRLGKTGEEMFRMMRSAQDRHITIMQQAKEKTAQIIGKTDINKLEREVHTFDLAGGKLTMSTAQVMSLYELMKREQARDHILKGGIRPDTITGGRALREDRRSAPVHVTAEDLATITGVLTEEQRRMADGLQKFMGGDLADLGNEASMEVYGYRKFNERDYFPIQVDKNQTKRDIAKEAQAATIAGRGFTKSVTPHANNAVMLNSIFDVYASHVNDMATYAAWLPTMENIRRIRDFTFRDEEGNRTGDVKSIIERVFGKNGNPYLNKLVDDINQGIKPSGTGGMNALVGNYKAAAVAANIRVILQQPTAILRAMNTLDPKYLLAGTVKRGDWGKVKKYAPIAVWKDWGYFDINTGRQMKDVLLNSDSALEKVKQASMAPAGKADSFAWARLWNAVEAETKDKRPGLKPGTDEFYRAVASRFGEIIDGTQVVDGLLQRSQIMRSPDALDKMATSFMGEPTKTYNMFVNAVYDLRNAEGKDALKKAKRSLARTTTALVVSFAVNAVMQSIVDALRDDDKERDYWEKLLTAYTGFTGDEEAFSDYWNSFWDGNLQANFNPLGYIPYAKDILSIAQGYDVSRMDMEPVSKVWEAATNMKKALSGEGKYSLAGASANLLSEAARLLGIPVANLKRDIQAGITTAAIETDSYLMQYRIDKAMLNMGYSGNTSNFLDILYNASVNDPEAYEIIYADMVASGIQEDKIRNGMESRMKKAQGVESVADLESRYLTPTQTTSYERVHGRVTGTTVWSAASAEQREALEEDLYDLTVANSSGLKLQEKIDGGAAYGIDEADYLLYRLALHVVDQPTESGNLGSYTGDEVEAAIDMLTGLDDEARAYLWEAAGKSEKSNPYK